MPSLPPVFILDAVRTPIGRYGGALASVRPDDLAGHAVRALMERIPQVEPEQIDDVYFGDANAAGEDNRNVARMAVLLAGLPTSVPGATVNRLCGSGMEAVIEASRAIAVGDASICIAGGVESMTRAPWVLPKPEGAFPRGHEMLHSTTLGWRMVNPRMPEQWTVSLGEGAEIVADLYEVSREEQDEFALRSHRRAAAAWDAGRFDDEVAPVVRDGETLLARDESVRATTTLDKLKTLKPAFRPTGTVTAGNASPLNDGASALLLCDEATLRRTGREPLARIVSRGVSAVEPHLFGVGPVEAANRALRRAGVAWGDLDSVELNEAFAAQSLACLRLWPELDPEIVNPLGGAIAIGHPLGCSGARLLTTLAWDLRHRGSGTGLATMCIGVGQGIATVLAR
ncbi:MAG TPA: thiolase family protein [Candidatus Dormibacteraeota bacterium]|jgi:acetyl-CoA acyltransferase|nr:thiolase family protein [Candidatus Dormibacteraeota bacterium]